MRSGLSDSDLHLSLTAVTPVVALFQPYAGVAAARFQAKNCGQDCFGSNRGRAAYRLETRESRATFSEAGRRCHLILISLAVALLCLSIDRVAE